MKNYFLFTISLTLIVFFSFAQNRKQEDKQWERKFEQLGTALPTPNIYRTASGAPGKGYWQQKADYEMKVFLNDQDQTISGEEIITYYNNSPEDLTYLWVQLDQNVRAGDSDTPLIGESTMKDTLSTFAVFRLTGENKIMKVVLKSNR